MGEHFHHAFALKRNTDVVGYWCWVNITIYDNMFFRMTSLFSLCGWSSEFFVLKELGIRGVSRDLKSDCLEIPPDPPVKDRNKTLHQRFQWFFGRFQSKWRKRLLHWWGLVCMCNEKLVVYCKFQCFFCLVLFVEEGHIHLYLHHPLWTDRIPQLQRFRWVSMGGRFGPKDIGYTTSTFRGPRSVSSHSILVELWVGNVSSKLINVHTGMSMELSK